VLLYFFSKPRKRNAFCVLYPLETAYLSIMERFKAGIIKSLVIYGKSNAFGPCAFGVPALRAVC
jgi:hypothetical protein